jgi:hypothetical protein
VIVVVIVIVIVVVVVVAAVIVIVIVVVVVVVVVVIVIVIVVVVVVAAAAVAGWLGVRSIACVSHSTVAFCVALCCVWWCCRMMSNRMMLFHKGRALATQGGVVSTEGLPNLGFIRLRELGQRIAQRMAITTTGSFNMIAPMGCERKAFSLHTCIRPIRTHAG